MILYLVGTWAPAIIHPVCSKFGTVPIMDHSRLLKLLYFDHHISSVVNPIYFIGRMLNGVDNYDAVTPYLAASQSRTSHDAIINFSITITTQPLFQMTSFLARDAFVRTYRRAIAMMFVRLSVCLSVCPSVWDGRAL